MSSYVRAPRQLPDAGGYPSLFTAPSASPLCSRVSSARFLVRLLLALIYYSAGRGRFINRLSLRIKPLLTRVGGRRTRRAARALISPPPPGHLFSSFSLIRPQLHRSLSLVFLSLFPVAVTGAAVYRVPLAIHLSYTMLARQVRSSLPLPHYPRDKN